MIERHPNEGGVSPVVAVILLVAVTVALSAVIGTFALDLGQSVAGSSNSAQSSLSVQTSTNGTHVTATVITGDADEVRLQVNGTTQDTISNATAGDTLTAQASDGDSVTIVTTTNGDSTVVASETVDTSTSGSSSDTTLVAWSTSSDWDASVTQSGVVHEQVVETDHTDAALVKKGYSITSPLNESSLLGYWPLMEDSGSTANDYTAAENDGTIYGAAVGQSAILGQSAYLFDGKDDIVRVSSPSNTDLNNSSWSYSGWFTTDGSNDDYNNRNVQFHYNSSKDGRWFTLRSADNSTHGHTLKLSVDDNSSKNILWGTTPVDDGNWHHVVAVHDASAGELRIYLDGQLEAKTSDTTASIGPAHSIHFGDTHNGDHSHSGKLSEMRLYGEALSSSEVSQLYNVVDTNGTLTTDTESFNSSVKPDLSNLSYTQNNGTITVTVTGSPGKTDAESHTVTLDGSSSYNLNWSSGHSKFNVEIEIAGANKTSTPVVNHVELSP